MIAIYLMLVSAEHFYPVLDSKHLQQKQQSPDEPKPCFGQVIDDLDSGSQKCVPKRCYQEDRKQTCYDLPKQG